MTTIHVKIKTEELCVVGTGVRVCDELRSRIIDEPGGESVFAAANAGAPPVLGLALANRKLRIVDSIHFQLQKTTETGRE